jgi:phosphatidylglycerophosphate synthase
MERRELATRKKSWAKLVAKVINNLGITPNQISLAGIVCAGISGYFFYSAGVEQRSLLLIPAALFIQLRLLCNMLDGMVAIEHQKKSIFGDLYNDVPDRFEDILIFVGAGCVFSSFAWLGWLTALLAVLTAYIRLLGKAVGSPAYFIGPQAKQHRMFVLTLGALMQAYFGFDQPIIVWVLSLIAFGSTVTFFRRLLWIIRDLKKNHSH